MPSYINDNALSVAQLHTVLVFVKQLIEALETRIDIQVTATTEPDADYAAEVLDGRVDVWGNQHGSIGSNIRDAQQRLTLGLRQVQETHQTQINDIAKTALELSSSMSELLEKRRLEISNEESTRAENNTILQKQIDELSGAVLDLTMTIADFKASARESQEE